jgi:hypothetical protein
MPIKHPASERIGGPGASHENREDPGKSKPRGRHPIETRSAKQSSISGGGGEPDAHHTHHPQKKSRGS